MPFPHSPQSQTYGNTQANQRQRQLPTDLAQLALAGGFFPLLLLKTLVLAGVKELHSQREILSIPCRPGGGGAFSLLPGQGIFQVWGAPQGSLPALPQASGLCQATVGFSRLCLLFRPCIQTLPLADQALMADIQHCVRMQGDISRWRKKAPVRMTEHVCYRGNLCRRYASDCCHGT